MSNLVIVESPAKAKTINKYLGKDFEIIASYGHIRGLPSKDGSVLPDEDFKMIYIVNDERSEKQVKNIVNAWKKAKNIYLATDPDREGEAIAWHIFEEMQQRKALKKDQIVKRVIFNEITKKAVTHAVNNPLDINMDLVRAQQSRQALDYLVGFTLSPVLWRKLPGSRSAGRVQSVALRLISEREGEIETFISKEYWSVALDFLTKAGEKLGTFLTHLEGKKLDKFDLPNKAIVDEAVETIGKQEYKISNVEKKQIKRNPPPPFITSSLQQEAARKLGFSAKQTMQVAQKLYEGIEIKGETVGLITYMRTDGVQLSVEAVEEACKFIKSEFGDKYLPEKAKIYKSKSKSAQEAHEAIRPTHINYMPEKIKSELEIDQFKLYELIWKRTLACQMENAILDQVIITVSNNNDKILLRAVGSTLRFDGFYKLYREGLDDATEEEDKILPVVNIGDILNLKEIKPGQHFTEPAPRFSEASLVKKLEELGIGRPSTYASIISVLQDRDYVKLDKKRFIPEERGRIVTAFLTSFFKKYVEYDFTAELENKLDQVSSGELDWKKLLKNFWVDFASNIDEAKNLEPTVILNAINELLEHHYFPKPENKICPSCQGELSIKMGKFGVFAACSNYPDCKYTRNLDNAQSQEDVANIDPENTNQHLGFDHTNNQDVYLKKGPYGYYVQLGEDDKGKAKPKRATIPAGIELSNVDMNLAEKLLALPKELGINPETNEIVSIGIGRFGPYILHNKKYTSVPDINIFLELDLSKALDLMKNVKPGKATNEPIRVIGKHPSEKEDIAIYTGRYGPYIKFKKLNVPLGKNISIDNLSIEDAIDMISVFEKKKKK